MIICLNPFYIASAPSTHLASLHPSLPLSLPAVHPHPPTVAGSSGESCLPCATGRQNAAVAEPVRTEQELE